MQPLTALKLLACVCLTAAAALAAEPFKADFNDGKLDAWRAVSGDWKVADGRLVQTSENWGRHIIVAGVRLDEGRMSVRASVVKPDKTSGACFGLVLRYPGEKAYTAVRVGAYGGGMTFWQPEGKGSTPGFLPEVGRTYLLSAEIAEAKLTVSVDGATVGTLNLTDAKGPGVVGFYTECQCAFDDLEITGKWRLEPLPEPPKPATAPAKAEAKPVQAGPPPKPAADLANVFKADFNDGKMDGWFPAGGAWKVADGKVSQTQENWGRHVLFSRVRLTEGVMTATMRVDKPAPPSGGSFGFVLRFPGDKGMTAVRVGAYNAAGLMQPVQDASFGAFTAEVGRAYQVRVEIAGKDTVSLYVDDKLMGSGKMTEADAPGTVGLYTECAATFDDVQIAGEWLLGKKLKADDEGTPELKVDFAEWSPLRLDPTIPFSVTGAIHVYYRNVGAGAAELDHVTVMGRKVDLQDPPSWVAIVRQQPARLEPGQAGRMEVQVNGLPKDVGLRLATDPRGSAAVPVTVSPRRGKAVETSCDLARPSPLQINFVGFSADLKTLYAYVQNNPALLDPAAKPVAIARIEVQGEDVSKQARVGSKTAGRDVVPVAVSLDKPLTRGQYVRVVLAAEDGTRTGHAVRAFPSKFNILVCTMRQARKDFLEDIYNHGATAVNRMFDPDKMRALGFDVIPMSGTSFLVNAMANRASPVEAMWVDEVDKANRASANAMLRSLEAAKEYLQGEDMTLPIINFNVCGPSGAATAGFLTAPDTVMHSYGWYMCPATRRGFGRVETMEAREYRMSRRPFWPYFRDSEIFVPRDPEAKTMKPRLPEFQRCLTPREIRWMSFGTLIQGAKSMAHWGYWANPMSKFYFTTEPGIRIGMGGIAGNRIGPYVIPDEIVRMLGDVWAEHGRINAELRVIGPLVAISDVSHLAKVVEVKPEKDRYGDPAAAAAALVSGLDSIVLVVLNHSIDPGKSPGKSGPVSNPDPPKYDPVDATVELRMPEWLDPRHVFSVDYDRIADVAPQRDGDKLRFVLPGLQVSKVFVITSSKDVKDACLARHAEMQKRLASMAATVPVPDEAWEDKNVK